MMKDIRSMAQRTALTLTLMSVAALVGCGGGGGAGGFEVDEGEGAHGWVNRGWAPMIAFSGGQLTDNTWEPA